MGMRKVVKDHADAVVDSEQCRGGKYYSTISPNNEKGFITRQGFMHGNYIVLCFDRITEGNGFGTQESYSTITEAVEDLLDHNMEVYEFDTAGELRAWLVVAEKINCGGGSGTEAFIGTNAYFKNPI